MKITPWTSALFFIFCSNTAYSYYFTPSEFCSPVDLRSSFSVKMRNQGEVNWCYAHAAADYLQFVNRVPEQISAADVAIYYGRRRWPRFLRWMMKTPVAQTGLVKHAMRDLNDQGYCPESYFPSEKWTKKILHGKDAGKTMDVALDVALEELFSLRQNALAGFYLSASDMPFAFKFKGMTEDEFMDVVLNTELNVFEGLRSMACDRYRKPFSLSLGHIEMDIRNRHTFSKINKVLEQGVPLTVDFFYGVLNNVDSYKKSVAELHTTLLMGRRYNLKTQECQYLIKNSYGESCDEYDSRNDCEAGYVWVGENALYGAMTSFVYITQTAEQMQGELDFQSQPVDH